MSKINEAYKNKDLETLNKYTQQAEREEKIAKETPQEKLARLKEEYKIVLNIISKLKAELNDLKSSETYLLKEKVERAKMEGKDSLEELATSIKEEIAEHEKMLEELITQYKNIGGNLR
jgi:DNA-binding ferritin-like protein